MTRPTKTEHLLTPTEALEEAELPKAPSDRATSARSRWGRRLAPHIAIGLGGILGANARYWIGLRLGNLWGTSFPWPTLIINLSGSLLLGFYLTLVSERFTGRTTIRLFIATGFFGAYTTFSTFSFETLTLLRHGAIASALLYIAGSLILGLVGVLLGILGAHAL